MGGVEMDQAKAQADLNAVTKQLLPRIKRLAARLRAQHPGIALEDLQQAGVVGLLKAMGRYDQYDSAKGKLETWLHPWILGEMRMHVRKDAQTRRYEREVVAAVEAAVDKRDVGCGNLLGDAILGIADEYRIHAYSRRTAEDELLTQEALARVAALYEELSERDREFVRMRYVDHLTLQEIADAHGTSLTTLSRWEQGLRSKIRRRLNPGG